MKPMKIFAIVILSYVGLVIVFETLLAIFQPTNESTLVITTTDADGQQRDRVVSTLQSDGKLYVAANHWPRAWYEQALAAPDIEVVLEGERSARRAVPVSGSEHEQVDSENSLPLFFRFLTGFPPRYFLRLDPRSTTP